MNLLVRLPRRSAFCLTLSLSVASILFASLNCLAAPLSQPIPYYGKDFYQSLSQGVSNDELINQIQHILLGGHQVTKGSYDQIVDQCSSNSGTSSSCYQHISLGYGEARTFMMGSYYLTEVNGEYAIPDMYCGGLRMASEFGSRPPGPKQIPNGNIVNTEHTWPQSRFSDDYSMHMQKSDLHHLFPTDNEMNSIRGNNEFGDVVKDTKELKCSESRFGRPAGANYDVFEPPKWHKGNVARALFYFSVHYHLPIGDRQEADLRRWNLEDPVDQEEMKRNNAIFKIQGNRNPFIDYPDLADRISDF